ncbi:MAG: tRNA lysidine(34) synthetase TilS [Hyphomicrobium sp.]
MSVAPITAKRQVSTHEADALLTPLLRFDALLLAVSGGSDSMALLELVADWRRRQRAAPPVFVATVDHALRAESRAEAEFVAARCAELGVTHAILTWVDVKPLTGVANAAREARYRLLLDHVQTLVPFRRCAVVTAHTLDDQAETLVMRLARGSGIDGLAAMPRERPLRDGEATMLVRPLLGVAKARLFATLLARGRTWSDDPGNSNLASERARVRVAMSTLADVGVGARQLAVSALRLGDARAALAYADKAFETTVSLDLNGEIFASLDRARFTDGPALLRLRLLRRLIARFGGDTPAPSLSEIEALAERLATSERVGATLGGVEVSASSRALKLWRERGRVSKSAFAMPPNTAAVWDNRFLLRRDGRPDIDVIVRPLGAEGRRWLAPVWSISHSPPAAAVEGQPAFWTGDQLIAVPSLLGVVKVMQLYPVDGLTLQSTATAGLRNHLD